VPVNSIELFWCGVSSRFSGTCVELYLKAGRTPFDVNSVCYMTSSLHSNTSASLTAFFRSCSDPK
jgi:hypothetical protein